MKAMHPLSGHQFFKDLCALISVKFEDNSGKVTRPFRVLPRTINSKILL